MLLTGSLVLYVILIFIIVHVQVKRTELKDKNIFLEKQLRTTKEDYSKLASKTGELESQINRQQEQLKEALQKAAADRVRMLNLITEVEQYLQEKNSQV